MLSKFMYLCDHTDHTKTWLHWLSHDFKTSVTSVGVFSNLPIWRGVQYRSPHIEPWIQVKVLSAARSFSAVPKRRYCQNFRINQLKIFTIFLLRPTLATVVTPTLLSSLSALLLYLNISRLVTSGFRFLYTFRTRYVASNVKGSAMAVEHVKATLDVPIVVR